MYWISVFMPSPGVSLDGPTLGTTVRRDSDSESCAGCLPIPTRHFLRVNLTSELSTACGCQLKSSIYLSALALHI
jgi:hypothetical protein